MTDSGSQNAASGPPEGAAVAGSADHDVIRGGLLNPDLDLDALAIAMNETGRVQIADALRPEVADVLHRCLAEQVPWYLAFRDRSGDRKMAPDELAAMTGEQRSALDAEILDIARESFQFRYDSFMMITAYKEKTVPQLPLHRVVEQINMPPWLEPMRRITGLPSIRRTDAQATRYRAGHFLTEHNDVHEEEGRLAAYVINLTRDWRPDWGGLLQFLDEDGEVIDTFYPHYNTISMFRVPATHWVSPVAAFATGERLAITGWLRT